MNADEIDRIVKDLKTVPALADLPEDQLTWLSDRLTEMSFPAGEIIAAEGGLADSFHILLEGEFQLRREADSQDARVFVSNAGDITGKLP